MGGDVGEADEDDDDEEDEEEDDEMDRGDIPLTTSASSAVVESTTASCSGRLSNNVTAS